MPLKTTLLQIISLITLSLTGATIELAIIGAPPEIVFLRENTTSSVTNSVGSTVKNLKKQLGGETLNQKILNLPTVEEYCVDGKCDIKGLSLVVYVGQETTQRLFDEGQSQFIDARPAEDFLHGHIPYSINLPVADFASGWPADMQMLIKEMPVVIYCEGAGCDASQLVAKHLVRYGFKELQIVEDGFPGWVAAGGPVAVGKDEENNLE